MTDLRNLASVVLAMLEADKIADARVHLRAYLAAPSEGMKPRCPKCGNDGKDIGNALVLGIANIKCWKCATRFELKHLSDMYQFFALSPARSGEPSAPQTRAEQYIGSDQERVFLEKKALGDLAAPQPVSGDAPKVEEVPLARKAAYALAYADAVAVDEMEAILRPYFPPASQTPDFETLNATIGDLGEIAEMLREPQHEPTGFDLSIALRLEQITQTLKSIDPLATPASTAQPAAPSLEECARAETWIEEWVDGTLGKGNRPCGWPNFGSISVKEVAAMLEAYRRHFAGAAGQPPLDKLRAIVFDQGRDVEYETPGSVPQAPNNHSDLFFGNLQYSLQTLFAKVGNPFKDLAEWGAVWEALESARKHFGVPQAEPPKEEKPWITGKL